MSTNLVTKRDKNNNLISSLINTLNYGVQTQEEKELDEFFASMNRALQEISDAENFFDNVVDFELVDHAIYKIEAAKSKYVYLLKQAKEKNIKVQI